MGMDVSLDIICKELVQKPLRRQQRTEISRIEKIQKRT
jgi:hypothetical protein